MQDGAGGGGIQAGAEWWVKAAHRRRASRGRDPGERERERESEGMVGDGSHEEIRSFFFVSVGSGSELFFLTAQLDVFQSNSKWNGDTSFYFPPQLNTSLITKESSTCCYEGPDGESVCVWESDLVNQIL
jgi:hypothetical protein